MPAALSPYGVEDGPRCERPADSTLLPPFSGKKPTGAFLAFVRELRVYIQSSSGASFLLLFAKGDSFQTAERDHLSFEFL